MKSFLVLLALATVAIGGQYRVSWNQHQDPTVTEFRVYKVETQGRVLLATSSTQDAKVTAARGDIIVVVAFNGVESRPSLPIMIVQPPSAPIGVQVVEIETSSNLTDWKPLAYIPLHHADSEAKFIRARISQR